MTQRANSASFIGHLAVTGLIGFALFGFLPSISENTLSSQATGTGATKLVTKYSEGTVVIGGKCKYFAGDEVTVVNLSSQLASFASGAGVIIAMVAVAVDNDIKILPVQGAVASAYASAVAPTDAQIKALFGTEDYIVLYHQLFARTADTVVKTSWSLSPRSLDRGSDDLVSNTVGWYGQTDYSDLEASFHSYIDIPVDLAQASAATAGDLLIDGLILPPDIAVGALGAGIKWYTVKNGAGASASVTFKLKIDGVECAGVSLVLAVAAAVVGAPVDATGSAFTGSTELFLQGATLDLEMDAKSNSYSAGTGFLRVPVKKLA